MKKVLVGIWITAVIAFFIDWGIVGLSLLRGDYEVKIGIYVGLVCLILIFAGVFYKLFHTRCPYCGKFLLFDESYCSSCKKEIHHS